MDLFQLHNSEAKKILEAVHHCGRLAFGRGVVLRMPKSKQENHLRRMQHWLGMQADFFSFTGALIPINISRTAAEYKRRRPDRKDSVPSYPDGSETALTEAQKHELRMAEIELRRKELELENQEKTAAAENEAGTDRGRGS